MLEILFKVIKQILVFIIDDTIFGRSSRCIVKMKIKNIIYDVTFFIFYGS